MLSMSSLAFRAVEKGLLERLGARGNDSLHRLEWVEVATPPVAGSQTPRFALLGDLRGLFQGLLLNQPRH